MAWQMLSRAARQVFPLDFTDSLPCAVNTLHIFFQTFFFRDLAEWGHFSYANSPAKKRFQEEPSHWEVRYDIKTEHQVGDSEYF